MTIAEIINTTEDLEPETIRHFLPLDKWENKTAGVTMTYKELGFEKTSQEINKNTLSPLGKTLYKPKMSLVDFLVAIEKYEKGINYKSHAESMKGLDKFYKKKYHSVEAL